MLFTVRLFLMISLIFTGMASRFMPHPPNFTALNAIALFGVFYFESKWIAFATVALTMILSDLVIGFYPSISFIYLSFGLITAMSAYFLKKGEKPSLIQISKLSLASSLLFFFVTNFGDWFMLSIYPKTMAGLGACYVAGLPFLTTQVLGDLCYSGLFFGLYELSKHYFLGLDKKLNSN